MKKYITIRNETKATVVGERIVVADSFATRLFGLLGRRTLDSGEGLYILPSSGVHTFGMRLSIDVVALDRKLQVVRAAPKVGPWRLSALSFRTASVLELPVGAIRSANIEPGDQLGIVSG